MIEKEKAAQQTTNSSNQEVKDGYEQHFKVISPGRMVAKRFFRSKLSIAGLYMIVFVFLFSFVGPLIVDATWGYEELEVFKVERIAD
ncbi:MAG TPA: hypothetical protein PKO35_10195, partial [Candidatus Atribacteria bacterium]|nr:hypothetical protein [Candidatus Atribacteria bacterium]